MPEPHARFLRRALTELARDERLVGVAAGGSYLAGSMDEWSDLDLVIAVEPAAHQAVLACRRGIAAGLGPLLVAFTGEHVHEPRLLICLYGPPLVHVDLKFVGLHEVAARVEDPAVLWERDGRLSRALQEGTARFPNPDLQWIEDRFWVWVHYVATKVGRGELFEALDGLGFLRARVLGPLALRSQDARPSGVRKIEHLAPKWARAMRATVARYEQASCVGALRATVNLYRTLRSELRTLELRDHEEAEREAMRYLDGVESRVSPSKPEPAT